MTLLRRRSRTGQEFARPLATVHRARDRLELRHRASIIRIPSSHFILKNVRVEALYDPGPPAGNVIRKPLFVNEILRLA
jgi:hypothetical protein